MIRLINYLITVTKSNIIFIFKFIFKYCSNPNEKYITAVKRIFVYLKETIKIGLRYAIPDNSNKIVYNFINSD